MKSRRCGSFLAALTFASALGNFDKLSSHQYPYAFMRGANIASHASFFAGVGDEDWSKDS
jgi:hypothetical protein